MLYSRHSYLSLPSKPGVYVFLDKDNTVLYVGKAINLKSRVSSYFQSAAQLGEKTRSLVSQIENIRIIEVESEIEALLLEAYYIKHYIPKYNSKLTDNKAYIMVRITVKEDYPVVLLARKTDDKRSIYFGPFPSSSSVKLVLKTIRKVFSYQSVLNHPKRVCLYHHLNLCPCPPVFDSPELRQVYRKNIKNIIRIFEGKSKIILKELQNDRDTASNDERFEDALHLQRRIQALEYITQPFHAPREYEFNPNLRTDLRENELKELQAILTQHGCQTDSLMRIECYDISHIQGTNTVASMIVFINGEKASQHYRRYKIRLKKTPDDFASMQEVLKRRLSHVEWEYPGLFIVDGGKGQVSSALTILENNNCPIPLIGIAKREETIIIPYKIQGELSFTSVSLSRHTKALQLIQRMRDEAHRFAITYHRKLRSKNALSA